ncbi:MAG: dihydrolipoamide acetyltransferase family protein [Aggregatilineales bacterium]
MSTKVIMPQLGESVVEGKVSKWLKQVGDQVTEFDPLLEVSTDKVDTEVPAPATGVVLQILVPEGQTVGRGTLLALIGQREEMGAAIPVAAGETAHAAELQTVGAHNGKSAGIAGSEVDQSANRISPVVARMAAEHQIDLAQIAGTGLGGRITKKDVEKYLANRKTTAPSLKTEATALPPWEQPIEGDLFKPTDEIFAKARQSLTPVPTVPVPTAALISSASEGEIVPLSTMRRAIADHMVRSKLQTSPHVTTVFEVDMSAVLAHQKANAELSDKQSVRLTLTAYFVIASVKALQAYPWINSQWTDQGVLLHKAMHIGIAVAIPDGLIVPVVHNAQDLSLTGAARQVNDLATRARAKQLRPDEVTGGTFTITNHGVSGSLFATPIINQPQAAILGIGALQKRPIVLSDERGDTLAIRPMLYATLTFDHRIIDGATGDGFMTVFKQASESWQ